MEISLPSDKTYIAAISGGVDSMVLLDLLTKSKQEGNYQIIVVHVDHGIRDDSSKDKNLVEKVAKDNNLDFEFITLNLGKGASEDLARTKRYEFLESLASKYEAAAIITAHHEDDLIETAILNIIRGTGRKGLTSLINSERRLRPLIKYKKADIVKYAKENNVSWREDSTNDDPSYLRNYIRQNIMPKLDASARLKLLSVINSTSSLNVTLDKELVRLISTQSVTNELDRVWFNLLPHNLAREVLATWLRSNNLPGFSRQTLERLVVSAKVARALQRYPIYGDRYLIINKKTLSLS